MIKVKFCPLSNKHVILPPQQTDTGEIRLYATRELGISSRMAVGSMPMGLLFTFPKGYLGLLQLEPFFSSKGLVITNPVHPGGSALTLHLSLSLGAAPLNIRQGDLLASLNLVALGGKNVTKLEHEEEDSKE